MPFEVRKVTKPNGYKVFKKGSDKSFSGKPFKTKKEALKQLEAININYKKYVGGVYDPNEDENIKDESMNYLNPPDPLHHHTNMVFIPAPPLPVARRPPQPPPPHLRNPFDIPTPPVAPPVVIPTGRVFREPPPRPRTPLPDDDEVASSFGSGVTGITGMGIRDVQKLKLEKQIRELRQEEARRRLTEEKRQKLKELINELRNGVSRDNEERYKRSDPNIENIPHTHQAPYEKKPAKVQNEGLDSPIPNLSDMWTEPSDKDDEPEFLNTAYSSAVPLQQTADKLRQQGSGYKRGSKIAHHIKKHFTDLKSEDEIKQMLNNVIETLKGGMHKGADDDDDSLNIPHYTDANQNNALRDRINDLVREKIRLENEVTLLEMEDELKDTDVHKAEIEEIHQVIKNLNNTIERLSENLPAPQTARTRGKGIKCSKCIDKDDDAPIMLKQPERQYTFYEARHLNDDVKREMANQFVGRAIMTVQKEFDRLRGVSSTPNSRYLEFMDAKSDLQKIRTKNESFDDVYNKVVDIIKPLGINCNKWLKEYRFLQN